MRRFVPLLAAAMLIVTAGASQAAKAGKTAAAPALHGYCPVAYVAMGKAVKGNPKFSSVQDGHRFLFANAEAKKMFDAAPAKFAVAYEGWCATAMSMGKTVESDPALFTRHAGRTYLFSSKDAKKAFDDMPGGVIEKADEAWAELTEKKK